MFSPAELKEIQKTKIPKNYKNYKKLYTYLIKYRNI